MTDEDLIYLNDLDDFLDEDYVNLDPKTYAEMYVRCPTWYQDGDFVVKILEHGYGICYNEHAIIVNEAENKSFLLNKISKSTIYTFNDSVLEYFLIIENDKIVSTSKDKFLRILNQIINLKVFI